jgi:hypothetical protein
MVTQELLQKRYSYDSGTGIFSRKIASTGISIHAPVGSLTAKGYLRCRFLGKNYYLHRLAWLYVYGVYPNDQIDHINGIKTDNRISNLRLVTNRENQQNRDIHRKGHSAGTTFIKKRNKWRAQIQIKKKNIFLGHFDSQEDARKAREKAELELL